MASTRTAVQEHVGHLTCHELCGYDQKQFLYMFIALANILHSSVENWLVWDTSEGRPVHIITAKSTQQSTYVLCCS